MNKHIQESIEHLSYRYDGFSDETLIEDLISYKCDTDVVFYLLYGRYESYLERIFSRLSSNSDLFPDLMAELLLHLLDKHCAAIRQFAGKSSFKTWLSSVAHNLFVNKLSQIENFYAEASNTIERVAPLTMTAVTDTEVYVSFRQFIACLSSVEQRIVLLKEIEGYNAAEIAQMLTNRRKTTILESRKKSEDVSVDNVYKIRQRAIARLAEILKAEKAKHAHLYDDKYAQSDKLYRESEDNKTCNDAVAKYTPYMPHIIANIWMIKADVEFKANN